MIVRENNDFFDDNVKAWFTRNGEVIGSVHTDGKITLCKHWTKLSDKRECYINTRTFTRIHDIWVKDTDHRVNNLYDFIDEWSDTQKFVTGEIIRRNYSITYLISDLFK